MSTNSLILLIVFGAILLILAAAWLGDFFAKHNINEPAIAQKVIKGLSVAEAFALAITPFLPIPYANIISKLFQFTTNGVNTAEALYKASAVSADQRKTTATSLITSELTQAGVVPDDEINKLISVSIDLMCRFLPHKSTIPPVVTPESVTAAASI
jgi:hypothetical protein